ncbi:MAG: UDP-N-acetylmuramoyl-tripeptide--D-alanyl-D-alanine ligase, partial [Nitrospiraceae bacterium]
MSLFTVGEVVEITGARVCSGQDQRRPRVGIRRVCTDSRDARPGDLFVALKGERFDGHQFVEAARQRGAIGLVVENRSGITSVAKSQASGRPVLLAVPDTLLAYQQLAAHHRRRFRIPVVAVTGSNGKTTAKDMVAHVLSERWTVLKTEGNLNNRIGVPQTLLGLRPRHQAAVVEMGVDHQGQTTRLAEIARPTVGLITNIGPDHLEFFGTVEASARAKGELLDLLPPDGAAVLNADDAHFGYLASRTRCRVVSFGLSRTAEVRATEVVADPRRGTTFRLTLPGRTRRARVILRAHGAHNLSNALAAAAVGHCLALSGAVIARGLARFRPATMRSQVRRWRDLRIINDCYNANPASMKAAIDMLIHLGAGGRTIAVLGDMLELGPKSPALHREVGAYLAERGVGHLILCGMLGRGFADGAREAGMPPDRVQEAPDAMAAAVTLTSMIRAGDVILVKGSRGMRMERVIEALTERKR